MEISNLPDELLLEIFKYLDLKSVLRCEEVCQHWRHLCQDFNIWNCLPIVYSKQESKKCKAEEIIKIITTHSFYIRHIRLQYFHDYAEMMTILKPCINIIKLELSMCKVNDEFVKDLQMWPNLKLIHFPNCLKDTGSYDFRYDHYKRLTSLNVPFFGLNQTNFECLLNCEYLCHIFLSKLTWVTREEVISLLSARKDIIRSFQIYGGRSADDTVLSLISECKSLQNLAIIHCNNLTDKGLLCLPSLKKLEYVNLWNNKTFTENALLHVLSNAALFNVKHLGFSRIENMSPAVVDVIAENYKLHFLSLYQCPLIARREYEVILNIKFPFINVMLI